MGMAPSIRILSSTDVDNILTRLDTDQLIDVHTARLFRTLALASVNTARSKPDDAPNTDETRDPGASAFVDSPHRLAVQAGTTTVTEAAKAANDDNNDDRTQTRGELYTLLVMPSSVANYGTTVKLISVPVPVPMPRLVVAHSLPPPPRGLPATTVVVDERTGAVKAVVNARALNIRTALGELRLRFCFCFCFCLILFVSFCFPPSRSGRGRVG